LAPLGRELKKRDKETVRLPCSGEGGSMQKVGRDEGSWEMQGPLTLPDMRQ